MKATIEIACSGGNNYAVRYGDVWSDRMTRGEALEVVATILFSAVDDHPYLKTSEEWAARTLRSAGFK